MEVKERIAFVRGLLEGSETLKNDQTTRTLWEHLLQVCDELADSIGDLEEAHDEIEEYVEVVDADLCDLEEEMLGQGDLEDDEALDDIVEDDELVEEVDYVRAECPRCGEEVYFEEGFLYDDGVEVSCPECGEVLYRGESNGHLDLSEVDGADHDHTHAYEDDPHSSH